MIVDDWHIPRSDVFSFTAQGEPWVVQSWLASLVYGLLDDAWGLGAVRVLMGLLTVAVLLLAWRLTRPVEGLLVRAALGVLVLAIGSGQWSERPLLFGLVGLGAAVLAAEDGLDARWLLPIGWVWVNTHGSFPLGLVYLAVVVVGRWLDRAPADVELRALRWLAGGTVLGALNPLGPRLLAFPVELLQRQDVLRHVGEWQSPGFRSWSERLFLVLVALAVLALVRRPSFRHGLVLAVFLVAALLGSRNIAVASLVLVPLLAAAAPDVGALRTDQRSPLAQVLALVGVAGLVVVTVARLDEPHLRLDAYPTEPIELLVDEGVDLEDVRLVTPDRVGNLLTLRFGPGRRVFHDDRFDMFPAEVTHDLLDLVHGDPAAEQILEQREIDLVLWPEDRPLTAILEASPGWRPLRHGDEDWVLLCRRGADLGGTLGSC